MAEDEGFFQVTITKVQVSRSTRAEISNFISSMAILAATTVPYCALEYKKEKRWIHDHIHLALLNKFITTESLAMNTHISITMFYNKN